MPKEPTEYHYILCYETEGGRKGEISGKVEVVPGDTRHEVYRYVTQDFADTFFGGDRRAFAAVSFTLEPNQL